MGKNKKQEQAAATKEEKPAGKKKGGGWKAQMEEEEKAAKAEEERKLAIKNKIKFVRARHILHEDRSIIEEAQGKLKQNLSEDEFAKLAEEVSQCPSSVKGGLLGYFGKGQMDPAFEEAAFKTPVGSMSDIVQSANGYHIIMVIETK